MLYMPERGIEKKGVVVVSDYLFYCLINGTAHQLVVIAVAELAYNETAQVRQHATHAQVADHPIDVIMPLADVLDKQDRELITEFVQTVRSALQPVQHTQIAAYDRCFSYTRSV